MDDELEGKESFGKGGAIAPQPSNSLLTNEQFRQLQDVPLVIEWLANIENARTRAAYQKDMQSFCEFVGIVDPSQFREVTRAHVIAWRKYLETVKGFAGATIRRKLATLSALYQFLCEKNAVTHNVVSGVKRPKTHGAEGSTPAISDEQMRQLLAAPNPETLKGKRDRAILATLGYHGIRLQELCDLLVRHYSMRDGVMKFEVHGKGDKIRYLPAAPLAQALIADYLEMAGHRSELDSALFRPVRNNSTRKLNKSLNPTSVLRHIVKRYGEQVNITLHTHGFCVHSLRVTSATNAWENGANIVDIQHWLGHANITTTRSYFRQRDERIEQSPSFKINY